MKQGKFDKAMSLEEIWEEAVRAETILNTLHFSDPAKRIFQSDIEFYLNEAIKLENSIQ